MSIAKLLSAAARVKSRPGPFPKKTDNARPDPELSFLLLIV
jgi:hypothetical protein